MKKRKRLFYAFALIASIVSLFVLYIQATGPTLSEQDVGTKYPTLYSDTHITRNAIVTDERFKDLANINKESSLASVAGSLQAKKASISAKQREKGTWLWTPTVEMTPKYVNEIITGAKRNGVRNIYLSIDSYLDIYVMPDGKEKENKKKTFDSIIQSFITVAHKNNMTVDAEAGWRNWAEPGNEYKAFAIVDYAMQFNATHDEKFRGFQYDIEPYMLDYYQTDKKAVLRNFVDLVKKTVALLENSDLEFSVVIPDFYDGASGETPRFIYGINYSYTFTHLLRVLDRKPGSTILVMAYRNQSEGADGSIEISEDEILSADGYSTKVVVAQETGDILPTSFTFYNTSLSSLNTQVDKIDKAFLDNESYNGIAIHYINALMELE